MARGITLAAASQGEFSGAAGIVGWSSDGYAALAWTAAQCSEFLAHAAEDRLDAARALAILCGMRRGEPAGLKWSKVDLGVGVVVSSPFEPMQVVRATIRERMSVHPYKACAP